MDYEKLVSELERTRSRLVQSQSIGKMGSWEYDPETGSVWWSEENYRLLGFEPGEVTPDFDLVLAMTHPDDRGRVRDATDAAVANKASYDVEHGIYRNDGALIFVHERGEVVCDDDGNAIRMNGTIQDITERKLGENELRRSEARFADAQRIAHMGNWDYDVAQDDIWWSDEIYRIMGVEPGSFVPSGEAVLELVHPEDKDLFQRLMNRHVKPGGVSSYEYRIIRPDGDERTLRNFRELTFDAAGTLLRSTGTMLDVTETRRAERALQESHNNLERKVEQRTQELDAQTELLRRAERSAHVGHFHRPLDDGQIYWSDELYRIFGVDKETFILTQESVFTILHPDDSERYAEMVGAVTARGDSFETEIRIVRPDGAIRHVHAEIETGVSVSGEPAAIFGVVRDITDQKMAERDLAESEERFALAMRGANDALWDWDLITGHVYRSPRYSEMLGYEGDEIANTKESASALVHPDDRTKRDELIRNCLVSGATSCESEFRMRHKDGHYVDIISRGFAVRNREGTPIRMVGTHSDISRRKKAEAALQESEERFSLAMRGSNDGLWDWDLVTDQVYRSPRYLEMLGYADGQLPETKQGGNELVHPDDQEKVDNFWARLAEGGDASYEVEARMRHKDDHYVDLLTRVFELRDNEGTPIRRVGTNTDISARKQAEAELLAATALAESGERIRSAFENVASGNVIINDKGIIEIFNPTASKIFGYTAEEVIGQGVKMLMPDPEGHQHDGYIRDYLETGNAKVIGIGREVTGLRKNGEEFPMHLGVGEMTLGGEVSFIGSITDLSKIKHLEEQVRRSQRLEVVGQLTGGVAHDFNNLLAIMIGNADLLEDMVGDDANAQKRVKAIQGAVDRGASLTQRLLAFSRQQTLSPVAKDVSDLIGGLEDMLQRTLGEMVDLRVQDMPDLWPATIDPHQFENALVNLAINARDAMLHGGILTIETANITLNDAYAAQLDEVLPGDYVKVAVSDTGTGMPPEVLERVFEPFFTTKEVGEGSGLGLSMVYGFVKQSGGHVTVYSELDHGTTINLFLPRSEATARRDDIGVSARELAGGSEHILVVEDDEDVRRVAVGLLRSQGYQVAEARDSVDAIVRLGEGRAFDLVFTDLVLSGSMNGVEIAEQAKRLQPNIKVLFTTGYAENVFASTGQLDTGAALVKKPYRRVDLLGKVRAQLDSDGA